jgi:hypothetical protein
MMNMLEEGFLPKKFCAMVAFFVMLENSGRRFNAGIQRQTISVCVVWRFWKRLRERNDFGNACRKVNLVMKFESMGSVTTI